MRIDLHTHSTASDGTDTPAELVRNAAAAGLDVIALTDHDTVARAPRGHGGPARRSHSGHRAPSCPAAWTASACTCSPTSSTPPSPNWRASGSWCATTGCRVPKAIVAKLVELGAPVTWEQVARIAGDGTVGRPHIAAAMVEAGVVETVSDAFTEEWIANDGRAYVGKHELDPFDALRLIKGAGGVAVFAHPLAAKRGQIVPESAIAELAEAGLDGVEADHADHEPATRARLHALAGDLGILATGSSDYHGSRKNIQLGELTTAPEVYAEITARGSGSSPVTG